MDSIVITPFIQVTQAFIQIVISICDLVSC